MKNKLILLISLVFFLLGSGLAMAADKPGKIEHDKAQSIGKKLAPAEEHEHDEQTEVFFREYFAEPWRVESSLKMMQNTIFLLGALILGIWVIPKLFKFFHYSKVKK